MGGESGNVGDARLLVVVRGARDTGTLLAWLRQLLPAAVLLMAPAALPYFPGDGEDAIVVDAEDIDSPMALADALAKGQARIDGD